MLIHLCVLYEALSELRKNRTELKKMKENNYDRP
jgi:hypothetical protein